MHIFPLLACQQLALAGAVAFWYFRKPTDSPVIMAIGKLLKYNLGSAAKGSILITIFKIPRLILTFLYAKWVSRNFFWHDFYTNIQQYGFLLNFLYFTLFRMKKGSDKGSECAQCCMKSCICCFWFLEKFIRFLNHNAYTVIGRKIIKIEWD